MDPKLLDLIEKLKSILYNQTETTSNLNIHTFNENLKAFIETFEKKDFRTALVFHHKIKDSDKFIMIDRKIPHLLPFNLIEYVKCMIDFKDHMMEQTGYSLSLLELLGNQ